MTMTLDPPAAVKRAVESWADIGPFTRKPMQPGESSFIFDWGVRVEYTEGTKTKIGYICLADEYCRRTNTADNLLLLSHGKTSAAVKHLRLVHHLESPKTKKTMTTKRKREEEIEHLRSSVLYSRNPARLNLLLETLPIINHNLPLCLGEYEESRLKEALVVKDEMQVAITAELIEESIIELYVSTSKEIIEFLQSNRQLFPNFTMVADFWTCKTTGEKYLGLRVYLIDSNWQFRSVLLGTRKFSPAYGDRDGGIRWPFLLWIKRTLEDFELTVKDFYGPTSDKGSDVVALLTEELDLRWEWCMAHMTHAATKASCGMNDRATCNNSDMRDLITKLTRTIYQVRFVEVTGDLFKDLCKIQTKTTTTKLLSYSAARVLSLTSSIKRVLEKWPALELWYAERAKKAIRDKKPPVVFPLAAQETNLMQLLSILQPVADLKRVCQAETPTQVEVLMKLFKIRLNDLNPEKPVQHYLATEKNPRWIDPSELLPLAKSTRLLLRDALDERYFRRYYDDSRMVESSFVFEMQQRLHPIYKCPRLSLNAVVVLVCRQHGLDTREACTKRDRVNEKIREKLLTLMKTVAEPIDAAEPPPTPITYFNELETLFAPPLRRPQVITSDRMQRHNAEELDRWNDDPIEVERSPNGTPESVLSFWRRIEHQSDFKVLSRAARVLFAIPASSCQIERDFSVSGSMVTAQRTSLSQHNIDMCSFLNRNREFVDLLQCEPIPKGTHRRHTPSCFTYPLDLDMDMTIDDFADEILANFISNSSLCEEEKDSI